MFKFFKKKNKDSKTEKTTMDDLNDDCLEKIFSFLPIQDVIKIERVCKRWKTISSITCRRVTITNDYEINHIENILQKFGESIYWLHIRCRKRDICLENVMKKIQKYCRKLLHLKLIFTSGYHEITMFNTTEFPFLADLKFLYIDFQAGLYNRGLLDINDDTKLFNHISLFLEQANGLENFFLRSSFPGEKKFSLKNSGKEICIRLNIESLELNKFLQGFQHLTGLKMELNPHFNFNLNQIPNKIEFLKIQGSTPECFKGNSYKTVDFSHLKKLKFVSSNVDDEAVFNFTRLCPLLEDISFIYCYSITGDCYRHLRNLKQLKRLVIKPGPWNNISSTMLDMLAENCPQLQEILCSSLVLCITEINRIINLLPKLKYFQLQNIENLTQEGFQYLSESVRQRRNGVNLEIYFRGRLDEPERFMLKEKSNRFERSLNNLTITLQEEMTDTGCSYLKPCRYYSVDFDKFDIF